MTFDAFVRRLYRFAVAVGLIEAAVVGAFLLVGPWWALGRGMPGAAVLIALLGLLFDWRALDVLLARAPALPQRGLVRLSVAVHLLALGLGGWSLARPIDPAWRLLSGSEPASDPRLAYGTDGALVMHTGAGQLLRRREVDWYDLLGPGNFAWEFHVGPDGDLWVAPRDVLRIDRYDPEADRWRAIGRPPGALESLAVGTGELLAVLDGRLHRADLIGGTWSEVQEVGRVRSVALAPGGAAALACGPRWWAREGGAWADVTPDTLGLGCSGAFVGGGGWRYVLTGGLWDDALWVAPPGEGFRRVTAPASDLRVLAPHPIDGRRAVAGTWGLGVWTTEDGGRTWAPLGLDRVQVRSLAVEWARGEVCAGSSNLVFARGVFCRPLPGGQPSAAR